MPFIKFGTAANKQFDISTTVINLKTQLESDGNWDDMKNADMIFVQVDPNVGQPIRYFVDGNVPTTALGHVTASGFEVKGSYLEDINIIRDGAVDSTVIVSVGKETVGLNQMLKG